MNRMLRLMTMLLAAWLTTAFAATRSDAGEVYDAFTISIDKAVYDARFNPAGDKLALATNEDGVVLVFDTSIGNQVAELKVKATDLRWSADGSTLMTANEDRLTFWRTDDLSKEFAAIPASEVSYFARVPGQPLSPDGKRVVFLRKDDTVAVWQLDGPREIAILDGHTNTPLDAAFSPDGQRIATAAQDRTARVWDAATGNEIARMEGHEKAIDRVRFSPDGTRILTLGRDQAVRVWDAASGDEIANLKHQADVTSAVFSPDGTKVLTGAEDGAAHVFEVSSGNEILTLKEEGVEKVVDVAFSADGSQIVTGSSGAQVGIWDAASGQELVKLNAILSAYGVAFSQDGTRVTVTPNRAAGIVFTRRVLEEVTLAPDVQGLWGVYSGDPNAPAEEIHLFCSTSPYLIHSDGLVEFMVGGEDEMLQTVRSMRCAADMTCDVFEGPNSATASQATDKAKFKLSGDTGEVCFASNGDQCEPVHRCPQLQWDDAAKASGHADQWDKLSAAANK